MLNEGALHAIDEVARVRHQHLHRLRGLDRRQRGARDLPVRDVHEDRDVDGDQRVFEVVGTHPDAVDDPLTVLLRGPAEPAEPPEGKPGDKPPSPSGL